MGKERRCKRHARGGCDHPQGSECPEGLHVDVAAICLTFTVDLESPVDAIKLLSELESKSLDDRAQCVRLVVYGFALLRRALLRKFFEALPLLHELVLPDRSED